MRHKLVMMGFAITLSAGMLLATQTMASAGKAPHKSGHGSAVNATGTVACSGAVGNIKLKPGWEADSNTLPAPSKAIFNVVFSGCSASRANITTRVFGAHLQGVVNFPTNDCTTNFGGAVALDSAPSTPINWNRAARIGPVIPATTRLSLVSMTGTLTPGVGIKFTFSHQTGTGSFATKTFSGEFDSSLGNCSPTVGTKNIPIASGNLSQP
jgi:hypothetical protein